MAGNSQTVIKQRMQVYGSPYRTCMECGRYVLKTEGPVAFYRSFTTQLSMNVPYQAVHFMSYEFMQEHLNPDREYDPWTHAISGGIAGACAATITMPLDVCKTLLNTQEICSRTKGISYVSGMSAAFKTVYEFQGIPGFFRGLQARIFYQMPATAISWSVYEFFKFALKKKEGFKADSGLSYIPSVQAQNGTDSSNIIQVNSMTVQAATSTRRSI